MKYVTMDIGIKKSKVALFNDCLDMIHYHQVDNTYSSIEESLDVLIDFITRFDYEYDKVSLGYCLSDSINPKVIQKYISEKSNKPVIIEDSNNIAALVESNRGAGKMSDSVYYLTLADTINGVLVHQNNIVHSKVLQKDISKHTELSILQILEKDICLVNNTCPIDTLIVDGPLLKKYSTLFSSLQTILSKHCELQKVFMTTSHFKENAVLFGAITMS
ncbi:MAG: hypothetical protein ACK5LC_01605 [Coprobacillaceae bacterium]